MIDSAEYSLRMKATILKALSELDGKASTPGIREHIGITKSNNFSANMADLNKLGYVTSGKDAKLRGGTGNIWSITKKGKNLYSKNDIILIPYPELAEVFYKRHAEMKKNQLNKQTIKHPKVSKGVGRAMDSIAFLIEDNERKDALLRSMRSMINQVLGPEEEEEVE